MTDSSDPIDFNAHLLTLFKYLEALYEHADTIRGCSEIALFRYGRCDPQAMRSTYYLLEKCSAIPASKLTGVWEVRKSAVRAKTWSQERRAFADETQERLVRLHQLLSAVLRLFPARSRAVAALTEQDAQFLGLLLEALITIKLLLGDN